MHSAPVLILTGMPGMDVERTCMPRVQTPRGVSFMARLIMELKAVPRMAGVSMRLRRGLIAPVWAVPDTILRWCGPTRNTWDAVFTIVTALAAGLRICLLATTILPATTVDNTRIHPVALVQRVPMVSPVTPIPHKME